MKYEIEYCDCETCKDSESPCAGDCDRGEECQGCIEIRAAAEDWAYECLKATGSL